MYVFALEISGVPFVLLLLLFLYVFFYTPIKLIVKLIAHAKAKADRLHKLSGNVVIAEYDPPNKFTPAEIGYLFDNKIGVQEVFATILDLSNRGLISIDDSQAKLTIHGVQAIPNNLTEFEKGVLESIKNDYRNEDGNFNIGPVTVVGSPKFVESRFKNQIKTIDKWMLRRILMQYNFVLREELRKQGYLKPLKEQIKAVLIRFMPLMFALMFLTIYLFHPKTIVKAADILLFLLFFAPFYFIFTFFLLETYQKIAGDPWAGTDKLKQLWPEIEGYREFIKQVDQDNLNFESENTKGVIKNKVLPYAIALGIDTSWKNKL
jgi:hypothetical protein